MITSVPDGTITFPMLGEGFSFSPPSGFTLFGFTIYWYGVIIALGFLLAFIYVNYYRRYTGLGEDDYFDYLLAAVPSAVVCSRLYYVIFNFSLFKDNLLDIFNTRSGGLAIYGGVIGAALAIIIVSAIKKHPYKVVLDCAAPGLLIGQALGRWGNFMNREAFGVETEIFCRMGLTDSAGRTIYVHPTFLYESLANLLGLLIIHLYTKKKGRRYDGQIFLFYVAWYGLVRVLIEGLRTDSLYIPNTDLRVSQVLAGVSFLAALFVLCYNGSVEHKPEKLYINSAKKKTAEPAEIIDETTQSIPETDSETADTSPEIKEESTPAETLQNEESSKPSADDSAENN